MNGQVTPCSFSFRMSTGDRDASFSLMPDFFEGGNQVFDGASISNARTPLGLSGLMPRSVEIVHRRPEGTRAKLRRELFLSLCQAERKSSRFLSSSVSMGIRALPARKRTASGKGRFSVFSQESDCVPARPAAEAAKDLLLRTDAERVASCHRERDRDPGSSGRSFKRYKRSNEFDDVGGVKYAIDGLLRDARHIIA